MHISVTFNSDGRVGVFAMYDGTSINVTTEANNLQRMLPGAVYEAVMERVQLLLAVQSNHAQRIEAVR